jgi:serine/threonine protein kinase
MWSFGVCLYQMAVAYLPTAINHYRYGSGPIPFRSCDWTDFDYFNLKNLIESCLEIDSSKRITAEEALNHNWFDV